MSAAGLAALLSSDGAFLHLGRGTAKLLLQIQVVHTARPTSYAERDLRMSGLQVMEKAVIFHIPFGSYLGGTYKHVLAKPPCFRSAVFASGYSDITLSYPSFLHPLRPGQVSSLDQPGYGALINQDHNCTAQYYGT
eukprot:792644-Pelagomonas_calceolata.AAC.3